MLRGATLKRPSEDVEDDRAAGARGDEAPCGGAQRTALRGAEKAVAADDPDAPTKAPKPVRLVVTGFGRFHGECLGDVRAATERCVDIFGGGICVCTVMERCTCVW